MPGSDFVLANSHYCILIVGLCFKTRNGYLVQTKYVILLLTLNIVLLCKTMYECGALIIRSKPKKILISSVLF